jgi:riboflavin synthase
MFTGLVESTGIVRDIREDAAGLELVIGSPFTDLRVGESIAVDGACLTVTEHERDWFRVHIVRTSLERTCFGEYRPRRRVNLERALMVGSRLGGHLVQGHVDGVGTVVGKRRENDAVLVDLQVPPEVAAVSIPLGSIAVDGVSLTVNAVPAPATVQISLIPHTMHTTTLGDREVGERVHLEGDMIGKYVKHLLEERTR